MTSQEEFELRCKILRDHDEDSEEYRAHMRRAAVEEKHIEFGGNALVVVFFILIAFTGLYFGTSGYGRYTADVHMQQDR